MDGNSGRASFNKSYDYTPLRKPHNHNAREDSSTAPTLRSSVLSPDAPVFVPKKSLNQSVISNYSNHAEPTQGLTKNFSNMNVAPKNVYSWHNASPTGQNHSNSAVSVQDRLNMSSTSVQGRLNMNSSSNHDHFNAVPSMRDCGYLSSPADRSPVTSSTSHVHGRLNATTRRDLGFSNHSQQQENDYSINKENAEKTEEERFALDYIAHIVTYLNENPGSFDTIATRALSVFEGFSENQFVLSNSMEIIFSKSIEEQNFRYMGARLYALLDSIHPQDGSTFRNLLNFKLTYHQAEILDYMQSEQYKVRGTALFLADLYMQLRNDGVRIPQIANSIVFCMNQLLKKTTPENIKCICLTLKLAGYDLERDYPHDVAKIIENLGSVKRTDVGTSRVLENVLKLQENNWGRSEIQATQTPYLNENSERLGDVPVFYGPDGEVLTEEENNFLESNLPCENIVEEEDLDSDEYELDPGMDAEMEKAYRDFLKTTPNQC